MRPSACAAATGWLLLTTLVSQDVGAPSRAAAIVHARFVLTALDHAPQNADPGPVLMDLLSLLESAPGAADLDRTLDDLRHSTAERLYRHAPSAGLAKRILGWAEPAELDCAARRRRWLQRLTECLVTESAPEISAWIPFAMDERTLSPAPVDASANREQVDATLLAAGNRLLAAHAALMVADAATASQVVVIANRWGLSLLPLATALADTLIEQGTLDAYATLLQLAEDSPDDPGWSLRLPRLQWVGPSPALRAITVQPLPGGEVKQCSALGFARLGVLPPRATMQIECANGGRVILQAGTTRLANIPPPKPLQVVVALASHPLRIVEPVTWARVQNLTDRGSPLAALLRGAGDEGPVRLRADDEKIFRDGTAGFALGLPDQDVARQLENCALLRDALGLRKGERILPCSKSTEEGGHSWLVIEVANATPHR